jgi:hypothetical protein
MFSYESVGLVLVYYIMLNVLNVFYCRLLDLACHDNNQSVQVNAILANADKQFDFHQYNSRKQLKYSQSC